MTALPLPEPAHRIARAAVWYWAVRNLIVVGILAAASVTPIVLIDMSHGLRVALLGSVLGVLGLLSVLAIGLPIWRYAVHRWEATGDFVLTRSGAIFRDWRIVPLHRVQTVEVSQGILERAFGIARLVIRTASYAGSTDIHGMNARVAREVADHLTAALTAHTDDGA